MVKLSNRRTGILVIAIAFALSGAASALMCSAGEGTPRWIIFLVGVPFAAVSVLFFANSPRLAPVLLVLNSAAWVVAYVSLSLDIRVPLLGMGLAGLLGAVCVAISTGIGRRNLLSLGKIAIIGVVGFAAAMPFCYLSPDNFQWLMYAGFIVWQVAIGVSLYILSAR